MKCDINYLLTKYGEDLEIIILPDGEDYSFSEDRLRSIFNFIIKASGQGHCAARIVDESEFDSSILMTTQGSWGGRIWHGFKTCHDVKVGDDEFEDVVVNGINFSEFLENVREFDRNSEKDDLSDPDNQDRSSYLKWESATSGSSFYVDFGTRGGTWPAFWIGYRSPLTGDGFVYHGQYRHDILSAIKELNDDGYVMYQNLKSAEEDADSESE